MAGHNPIHILHVLYTFDLGGLENGVTNIINATEGRHFRHFICCMTTSGKTQEKLEKEIPVYELHKQPGNDWRALGRLVGIMRRLRPDIVHTRNWGATDGIVAARLSSVPCVIHGEHGWKISDIHGRNLKRRIARRGLSLLADNIVAVSQDIKNWLMDVVGISEKKVVTIINGVDTGKFIPCVDTRLRFQLGLDNQFVFGSVGRLDPIKQYDLLMRAFSKLACQHDAIRLVLVGDGPDRTRLEALKQALPHGDRILFLGAHGKVSKLYNIMDVFSLTSKNEGISNTILEAMSAGLPIVATAVGGNPELVSHMKTGMLVPSNAVDALQAAMGAYLNCPELMRLHGRQAREAAVNRFSLNHMVAQYTNLYTRLYRKKSGLSNGIRPRNVR